MRVAGVLVRPRQTLASLATAPRWFAVLACSTAVAALATGLFFSTDVGRQALVDRWERTAYAFGHELDDAGYARLVALGRYAGVYGAASAIVEVGVVSIAVAVAAHALFKRAGGPGFATALAVAAHASVILALRLAIAAPVGYVRETAGSATLIGSWLPILSGASAAGRLLGLIDLAVVWWAVVVGIGMAAVYGRPARRIVPGTVGTYIGLAILVGAIMVIAGPA